MEKNATVYFNDLRASYDTRHFGASVTEGEITIWKTGSFDKIACVRPGFERGGNRYTIDPINRLIFSATWENGLTCFDYEKNKPVWHRDDILGIQRVDISSAFPASLFVAHQPPESSWNEPGVTKGVMELDAYTGETMWADEGGITAQMHLHPSKTIFVIADGSDNLVRIFDEKKRLIGSIPMMYFAVLDVAFSDDRIAIAEGSKGIRVIDFEGNLVSSYVPTGRESNCIKIAFTPQGVCAVDSWQGTFVTHVDPQSGKVLSEYQRDSHGGICFIDSGTRFVDQHGHVCRSADGEIETKLSVD